MNYWWVNQGGTYKHEVPGNYMWSPKKNNNGSFSQYYYNMTLIEPGDVVFSYAQTKIRTVGIAVSSAYESPKPMEFGEVGAIWANLGWRVDVVFSELPQKRAFRPKELLEDLLPLRPAKYSPIQANGDSVTAYLFQLPEAFASVLLAKVESTLEWQMAQTLHNNELDLRRLGEDRVQAFIDKAPIGETERKALVSARRGQGRFREGVSILEPSCRFTGVSTPELLTASHIRPWHRCQTNDERLDPFNGLMLTPTYDRLFDHGLIGFLSDSRLLVSRHLKREDVQRISMDPNIVIEPFREKHKEYLEYHRNHIFRAA